VKVNAADLAAFLIEADVVKALEAGAVDGPHTVVRDEKMFLPPHEDNIALRQVLDLHLTTLTRHFLVWTKGLKLAPMRKVYLVSRPPRRVLCNEAVLGANDLALEVRRQRWVIVGEA
jgi:hypothetical protein